MNKYGKNNSHIICGLFLLAFLFYICYSVLTHLGQSNFHFEFSLREVSFPSQKSQCLENLIEKEELPLGKKDIQTSDFFEDNRLFADLDEAV